MWRRPLSEITPVQEEHTEVPYKSELQQNYPNPFNPSTTITFSLSRPGFTTLKLFDMVGREVATLISQNLPAGLHRTKWDASKLTSGIYFYRLQVGAFSQTKKFVLLR